MTVTADDKQEVFSKAVNALVEAAAEPLVSQRDKAGVIQTFKNTYELCW